MVGVSVVHCKLTRTVSMLLQSTQFRQYAMTNSTGVLLVLLCSSIIALLYNMVHALMIKKTSAVTVTVLGEVKVIGLLILSAILLGKQAKVVMPIGSSADGGVFKAPLLCLSSYLCKHVIC